MQEASKSINVEFSQYGKLIIQYGKRSASPLILNYDKQIKYKVQGSCSRDQTKQELSDSGRLFHLDSLVAYLNAS